MISYMYKNKSFKTHSHSTLTVLFIKKIESKWV